MTTLTVRQVRDELDKLILAGKGELPAYYVDKEWGPYDILPDKVYEVVAASQESWATVKEEHVRLL